MKTQNFQSISCLKYDGDVEWLGAGIHVILVCENTQQIREFVSLHTTTRTQHHNSNRHNNNNTVPVRTKSTLVNKSLCTVYSPGNSSYSKNTHYSLYYRNVPVINLIWCHYYYYVTHMFDITYYCVTGEEEGNKCEEQESTEENEETISASVSKTIRSYYVYVQWLHVTFRCTCDCRTTM